METWRCPQAGADAPRDWGLMVHLTPARLPPTLNHLWKVHRPLTLSCLTTCETTSLLPVSSPRYASSSKPSLLQ